MAIWPYNAGNSRGRPSDARVLRLCRVARPACRVPDSQCRPYAHAEEDLSRRRRRPGYAGGDPRARQLHGIRAALPGADLFRERLLRLLADGDHVGRAAAVARAARRRPAGLHSARPHDGRGRHDDPSRGGLRPDHLFRPQPRSSTDRSGGQHDGRAGHRSALAVRRDRALCGLVAARPAADPERPLVRAPPPQPADRPRQPAAGRRDKAVPAHQAPGADRPPGLRPAGGRRRQRLRPRQQPAARGGDDRGPSLRARDRADLQRLYLFPAGLLDRPRRRPLPLPRAPGLRRRAHHGRRGARHHRGVRHEPPQQHGLRAGGLPGGRAHGALLRRRRMGAHLAIAAAHPLDGRLLRAPQLQQSDLSPGAGALRAHGDRGGRRPGDVSRGRPVARRQAARAQARPVRLHAEIVRSQGRPRHRLRAGGAELRPRARGPHLAALARQGAAAARRAVRRAHRARLLVQPARPDAARPLVSFRLCLREFRRARSPPATGSPATRRRRAAICAASTRTSGSRSSAGWPRTSWARSPVWCRCCRCR